MNPYKEWKKTPVCDAKLETASGFHNYAWVLPEKEAKELEQERNLWKAKAEAAIGNLEAGIVMRRTPEEILNHVLREFEFLEEK